MTKVSCASGVELLIDYLEGVLEPETRAAIDAHVAGCPRCQAFIGSYQDAPRVLRDATAIEMPADLEASLLTALRSRRNRAGPFS